MHGTATADVRETATMMGAGMTGAGDDLGLMGMIAPDRGR
jgi:hypothetical protein